MSSPFNLLTTGARFDRSRFQNDFELFTVSSNFRVLS